MDSWLIIKQRFGLRIATAQGNGRHGALVTNESRAVIGARGATVEPSCKKPVEAGLWINDDPNTA